jgi:hypothetical protein
MLHKFMKDIHYEKPLKNEKEVGKDVIKDFTDVPRYVGPSVQPSPYQAATAAAMPVTAPAALTGAILPKPYKEFKEFAFEKYHLWDKFAKTEKIEYPENWPVGRGPVGPGDPVEQRLAALEAAVGQLAHFIPQELRPDLSKGALKQEPGEAQEADKKK